MWCQWCWRGSVWGLGADSGQTRPGPLSTNRNKTMHRNILWFTRCGRLLQLSALGPRQALSPPSPRPSVGPLYHPRF